MRDDEAIPTSPPHRISRLAIAVPVTFLRFGLPAAALFSLPGERFAVTVVDPHEGVAPLVVAPAKRRLNRGAGHPGPLKQIKGSSHDRALHLGVPGLPAGVSQWEVGEHEAGDAAFLDDVAGRAQYYRRHAVFFEVSGDQTHGLVADRSECREEHGADTILTAPLKDLRGVPQRCPALAVVGGDPIEAGRHRLDAAASSVLG